MSRIRGQNTGPERRVRSLLHRQGFRFTLTRKDLPGKPDIVMPRWHAVIFVHAASGIVTKGARTRSCQKQGRRSGGRSSWGMWHATRRTFNTCRSWGGALSSSGNARLPTRNSSGSASSQSGRRMNGDRTPVVDLFAGPGGLGEGFSAYELTDGRRQFRIVLSIEMDDAAHRTLELRSFFRQFQPSGVPEDYYHHLQGTLSRDDLFRQHEVQATAARVEAWKAELGKRRCERTGSEPGCPKCGGQVFLRLWQKLWQLWQKSWRMRVNTGMQQ